MSPSANSSTVLAPFQSLFSAPTLNQVQGRLWRKVQRLFIGTLLARGRRTVTAAPGSSPGQALRHTGQDDTPSFSLYHQVFNRARWSALKGSRCLLSMLVQAFDAAGGSLTFVIDETLERRWGPTHQQARALSRPAGFQPQARRQHQRAALDRADPGCHATLEQPLLGLAHPRIKSGAGFERAGANTTKPVLVKTGISERLGLRHKTVAQWARQMIRVVRCGGCHTPLSPCLAIRPTASWNSGACLPVL